MVWHFFSLYKKKFKNRAIFFSKQYEILEHFFYLCPNVDGRVVRPMSWFWQLTWVLLQEFSASHSSSGMISFSILDHKIYLVCHIKVINMDFFTSLFLFTMQWETFVLQMSHGHKLDRQTYFSKEPFSYRLAPW